MRFMRMIIAILMILSILSCAKTQEKLFTANELCRSKEYLDDPNNMRDKYDDCLLFTDEELKSPDGCKSQCLDYCDGLEMNLQSVLVNMAGCTCICEVRLRQG